MSRKNIADWESKIHSLRPMSEEPRALSPIQESDEEKSMASPSDGATTLPELIIERVPKRRYTDGESAHFYDHLRKRMRKYYRRIFKLSGDDGSSGTEFDDEAYDEYNPEYTIVTHQDELTVSYVTEQPDRESDLRDRSTSYLGSLSSRKDSSERERVSVSKSSGSEKRQTDKAHPAISKDGEKNDKSEDSAGKRRDEDSHTEEKSADEEMETEEESDQLGENQEECGEEEESSNEECERNDSKSGQMTKSQDGERENMNNFQSEDSAAKEEDSHVEEKSTDEEMETEEESDQLGETQDECGEEEESNEVECERNDSKSDQNMSKSQDIEEEESELAEKDSDQSPEELEIMRSFNPAPSIDSLRHDEAPSDTEENISLNRFTHRHSDIQPQHEAESPSAVAPEIQATHDDYELNVLIRTSTPRKSKETGTKRPSDLVHEEEATAKKRYFRNIRIQTDEIEKQGSCVNVASQTDCIHVRHFGIQTEEKSVINKNVSTQTDMPQGEYRSIGVQTDRNHLEWPNVGTQTDGTEVEQRDAETQADLRHEGGIDVGVQTDERRREDNSYELFERRGIFFFFF